MTIAKKTYVESVFEDFANILAMGADANGLKGRFAALGRLFDVNFEVNQQLRSAEELHHSMITQVEKKYKLSPKKKFFLGVCLPLIEYDGGEITNSWRLQNIAACLLAAIHKDAEFETMIEKAIQLVEDHVPESEEVFGFAKLADNIKNAVI